MIPASTRLPEVPDLVANQKYFVVHAPRQTGKTTALRALAAELTTSGRYAALVLSMEAGQGTPTRRWPASSSSTATSRDQRPAERKRVGIELGAQTVTSPGGRAVTVVRI
jgi:hypothetical protein